MGRRWQREGQGRPDIWRFSLWQDGTGLGWRTAERMGWGKSPLGGGCRGTATTQSRELPPDGERAAGKTQAAASHAPAAWPCPSSPGCEMHASEVLGLDPPGASRPPKPGAQSHILCVLPTTLFPCLHQHLSSLQKYHLLRGSSLTALGSETHTLTPVKLVPFIFFSLKQNHSLAQAALKLLIPLPQPLMCWDDRYESCGPYL